MIKMNIIGMVAMLIIGCASMVAETPQQRAFAAVADYTAIQSVARAYASRADADPDIKAAIKEGVSIGWPASLVLRDMANGDTLSFCEAGMAIIIPDDIDRALAVAACDGDLSSVTGRMLLFTVVLRTALERVEVVS